MQDPNPNEVVIPVLAEEIAVGKQEVTRGVVRVHKRVATREEVVEVPVASEELLVERRPINTVVEGEAPQVREEEGVIIIPVLEEVLVVEKRLILREEVRLSKKITAGTAQQTVLLRHETVEIERLAGDQASAGLEHGHAAADGGSPAAGAAGGHMQG
jgi:uncharacterized protein (TIGR02271 family)